ncbi:glycosyltransferase family 4 protein [Pedobacter immunditicola]|uniref:glycosyltransferase family 4 protein n=1 Tax=Pedobacter immunditicola TaxID=3133440 RepID=UPI00309B362E
MKRILFITQNLNRTGSEMVLWYLLNNLDPEQYAIYVFCIKKGDLYDQLPEHVQKSLPYKVSGKLGKKIGRALLKLVKANPLTHQLKHINESFKPEFWFVNTLVIPEAHRIAALLNVKVVTYFHESLNAFSLIKSAEMDTIINYSSVCIGCSEEVCRHLTHMGHPNVQLQPSFIDYATINVDKDRINALKQQLGITASDFVWVISGGATYMKGLDYILPILEGFKDEQVKILWLGYVPDDGLLYYVKEVVERKYKGKLFFLGPQAADYYNYMAIGNGFLLLSREESFSLVMLEAAYLGIPIVAFNTGIASTFVKKGMGRVIYSRNIEDLILEMKWLHDHPGQDLQELKNAALAFSLPKQVVNFEKLIGNLFP